jgi:multisubunit Na+/H+ antiporter MnhG subunit
VTPPEIVATVLMVVGTCVLVVASVGASLPRSPLVRLHYLSLAAMAGAPLVLLGVLVYAPVHWFKVLLITGLLVGTSPVATSASARVIDRGGGARAGSASREHS